MLRGMDVREVFETVLPEEALRAVVSDSRMQARIRKLDPLRLIRSAVIAAARGDGGRQATTLAAYFESGGEKVVRGASYGWFSPAFESAMDDVCKRAMAYAAQQPRDLPGWLGEHVVDWHIVDSSTVKLDDELLETFPGAGKYAALKIHKRFSVGVGTTVGYTISPARDHDAPHLVLDESWRGHGLLVDLGYASHTLLRDAERLGVSYVLRLKESWKPKVDSIVAGDVTKTFVAGTDLDVLLDDDVLVLSGKSIDADVTLGKSIRARLVGVEHEGTYRYYLTNLPRERTPEQVSTLYRVRWEIELDNKLDKSGFHIDAIVSRTPHTVRVLVHAAITASVIVCLIAHKHRLWQAPPPSQGAQRDKPPIHVQTLARKVASAADRIAVMMTLTGDDADHAWEELANHFLFFAVDPNWRHRPSVLDQLRGWSVRPAPSRGGGRKPRKAAN